MADAALPRGRSDITSISLPVASYDVVGTRHVRERIADDCREMSELYRFLRPGGISVRSAPINASRAQTYENSAIGGLAERAAYLPAADHRRYYGLGFAERLADAGFKIGTFRLPPEHESRYGPSRDEWLTIARKPA